MVRDRVGDALVGAVRLTRGLTLAYAVVLAANHPYAHPWMAGLVISVMVFWTGFTTIVTPTPGWPVLIVDLVITWLAVAATAIAESAERIAGDDPTLPSTWAAAVVVAWAVARGPWWGALAGGITASASIVVRGDLPRSTFANVMLLLLIGVLVGVAARLAREGSARVAAAEAAGAAERERSRLAREVHDGVLQLLTLVSRSDSPLAEEAAEQQRALRRLISGPAPVPVGEQDLMARLPQGDDVSLVGPGSPVVLPTATAEALAAAAGAAISNVRVHAGGTAHVLVDDLGDRVEVLIRDDGPGFSPADVQPGRLGLRGMVERLVEVGGSMTLRSAPGEGTEITLTAPRRAP